MYGATVAILRLWHQLINYSVIFKQGKLSAHTILKYCCSFQQLYGFLMTAVVHPDLGC